MSLNEFQEGPCVCPPGSYEHLYRAVQSQSSALDRHGTLLKWSGELMAVLYSMNGPS